MNQTIHVCNQHPDCTVIITGNWPAERGSSISHFAADLDPAARLNDTYPEATDRRPGKSGIVRRRNPTAAERARLNPTA